VLSLPFIHATMRLILLVIPAVDFSVGTVS
jgi:hypothetical protein